MSDDYETPRWLLEVAFPNGYFDPCPIHGKQNGPDGLKIEWPTDCPVFINPPYSRAGPWVQRAAEHTGPVALLVPVSPDSDWWRRYARFFKVTLIEDEVKFLGWGDGKQKTLTEDQLKTRKRLASANGSTKLYVAWWRKP